MLLPALLVTIATGATAAGPAERAKALQAELDAATAKLIEAREGLEALGERLANAEREERLRIRRGRDHHRPRPSGGPGQAAGGRGGQAQDPLRRGQAPRRSAGR